MAGRSDIIAFLRDFPGQEQGDLDALDALVAEATAPPPDPDLDKALFGIFERYPDEDGYGVYWSILHGLERRGDYETALLESVRRAPSDFAVRMLNRIWNTGKGTCAGCAIRDELALVLQSPTATEQTKSSVRAFLEHHAQRRLGRRRTSGWRLTYASVAAPRLPLA